MFCRLLTHSSYCKFLPFSSAQIFFKFSFVFLMEYLIHTRNFLSPRILICHSLYRFQVIYGCTEWQDAHSQDHQCFALKVLTRWFSCLFIQVQSSQKCIWHMRNTENLFSDFLQILIISLLQTTWMMTWLNIDLLG